MSTWLGVRLDALTAGYFLAFVVGAWFSVASWLFAHGRRTGPRHPGPRLGRAGARGARAAPRAAAKGARAAAGAEVHTPLAMRVAGPLLDPSAWAALLGAGGGVGYIARAIGASAAASVCWALPVGLTAAYAIGRFVDVLQRGTRYAETFSADGTVATVLQRIGERTIGEVLCVHGGSRRCLPAASESGRAIHPGTEVIVVRVERGIAKVAPTSEVLGEVHHGR